MRVTVTVNLDEKSPTSTKLLSLLMSIASKMNGSIKTSSGRAGVGQ